MAAPKSIIDHNRFYSSEDRKKQPKEYFKFLASLAGPLLVPGSSVLDVGCATGDLLYFLRDEFPGLQLTGTDNEDSFLEKTAQAVPGASLIRGNIQTGEGLPAEKFDVVFMAGVNYLFADPRPWLENICGLTKGTAYVFGVFNPEELDVRMMVSRPGCEELLSWNLISQQTISNILGGRKHRFIAWNMPLPIARTQCEPLRSWTVESSDGFLVLNGMQVVHRFAALEITV